MALRRINKAIKDLKSLNAGSVADEWNADIVKYIEEKPNWSFFKSPDTDTNAYDTFDDDHDDVLLHIPQPTIPSCTLHLSSYGNIKDNKSSHLIVNYSSFIVDYSSFASSNKLILRFSLAIEHKNKSNLSFNLLIRPYAFSLINSKFDSQNLYSQINDIKYIHNINSISIYSVSILLATTSIFRKNNKYFKLFIQLNIHKLHSCIVSIPCEYFEILKHSFINTIYKYYSITIFNDIYSIIMQFAGKLHWCLGESFISDTLDISQTSIDIELINRGLNPKIKNIYYVCSSTASIINKTSLNGIDLLIYNNNTDILCNKRHSISNYDDYIGIRFCQIQNQQKYGIDCKNDDIISKNMSLDIDNSILLNSQTNKYDFMMWIEWEESISLLNWDSNMFKESFNNLIDWYEMKRINKENQKKIQSFNKIQSIKKQRKTMKNKNNYKRKYYQNKKHVQKHHYHRW